MQLFISSIYTKYKDSITIHDERTIHQCFHVLRYKNWQILQLQDSWTRYTLSIIQISKKEIITKIQSTETHSSEDNNKKLFMLVALPNRRDKAELIAQKLTEIGVENIVFWKAKRSVLRELPTKKLERLYTITLEASEQAFRRSLPTITYLDNLFESDILSSSQIILFHQDWISTHQLNTSNTQPIASIIGPEWWFAWEELEQITQLSNHISINLWATILRMETAAIIWARLCKNL